MYDDVMYDDMTYDDDSIVVQHVSSVACENLSAGIVV